MPPRRLLFVVFDGMQPLDLVGPHEVFEGVNRLTSTMSSAPQYRIDIASMGRRAVTSESGLSLNVTAALDRVRGPFHTVVCVGGFGTREAVADRPFVRHLERVLRSADRVASVCTGALLLAEAGVLDGRRATTHWNSCEWLAKTYPRVRVEPDAIFVRDGEVWTSAGVTAGIDLALAMVAADFPGAEGEAIARQIARWLVVFARRPGGQSQFSESLRVEETTDDAIRRVLLDLPRRLAQDCGVPALAAHAAMSPRTFARRFKDETGRTPADYVTALRIEAARLQLAHGEPLTRVAATCGFGTVETLHRTFRRRLGTTPDRYRQHFAV